MEIYKGICPDCGERVTNFTPRTNVNGHYFHLTCPTGRQAFSNPQQAVPNPPNQPRLSPEPHAPARPPQHPSPPNSSPASAQATGDSRSPHAHDPRQTPSPQIRFASASTQDDAPLHNLVGAQRAAPAKVLQAPAQVQSNNAANAGRMPSAHRNSSATGPGRTGALSRRTDTMRLHERLVRAFRFLEAVFAEKSDRVSGLWEAARLIRFLINVGAPTVAEECQKLLRNVVKLTFAQWLGAMFWMCFNLQQGRGEAELYRIQFGQDDAGAVIAAVHALERLFHCSVPQNRTWQRLDDICRELSFPGFALLSKTFQNSAQKESEMKMGEFLYELFQLIRERETMKVLKGACAVCGLPVMADQPHTFIGPQVAHRICSHAALSSALSGLPIATAAPPPPGSDGSVADVAAEDVALSRQRSRELSQPQPQQFTDDLGLGSSRPAMAKERQGAEERGAAGADDETEMADEEEEQRKVAAQLLENFIQLPTTEEGSPGPARSLSSTAGICEALLRHGPGPGMTFAVRGEEGSGKSSLCAFLAQKAAEKKVRLTHLHIANHTRHSCNPVFAIRRIVRKFKQELLPDIELPRTLNEAPHALNLALAKASSKLAAEKQRGLLIFDGVDAMDNMDGGGALALSWMKRPMPDNMTLLFTYSDSKRRWLDWMNSVRAGTDAHHLTQLNVPVPTPADALEMIERFLKAHEKRGRPLTQQQTAELQRWLRRVEEYPHNLQIFPDRTRPLMLAMLREELLRMASGAQSEHEVNAHTKLLLASDKSVNLMKTILTQRMTHQKELYMLAISLIVSAPGGLEREDLDQCLRWASSRDLEAWRQSPSGPCLPNQQQHPPALLSPQSFSKQDVDSVLRVLAPFTRNIPSGATLPLSPAAAADGDRRGPRNNVVVRVVRLAFMGKEHEGQKRRKAVLSLLEACWLYGLERAGVSAEKKAHMLVGLPVILQEQAAADGDSAEAQTKLSLCLRRLDVFLEHIKREHSDQVLRFHRFLKHNFLLDPPEKLTCSLVPEDLKELGVVKYRSLFLGELQDQLREAADKSETLNKYEKVAAFLMDSGDEQRDAAYAVLVQGLHDAQQVLRESGSQDGQHSHQSSKVAAVVVKLLCMLNALFGRHQYDPEKTENGQRWQRHRRLSVQARVLQQADELANEWQDGEENWVLLKAEILNGQGYLEKERGDIEAAALKFEQALCDLNNGERWDLGSAARAGSVDERMALSTQRVTALADTLNALGTAHEERLAAEIKTVNARIREGIASELELHRCTDSESFASARAAYEQSLELGALVSDEMVGRSHMSLGKLWQLVYQRDDAESHLVRSIRHFETGLGGEHKRLALPHWTLASLLESQGRLDAALLHAQKAEDIHRQQEDSELLRKMVELRQKIQGKREALQEQTEQVRRMVWAEHREQNRLLWDGCASPAAAIQAHKEVRVFVSSPFNDFHEERELLVRGVFPDLRALCQQRGVQFVEIDFRTGVTEEQSDEGQVVAICLREVTRCQYFVSMMGMRYGWCGPEGGCLSEEPKLQKQFVTAQGLFPEFRALLEAYADRSVSELEVRAAALNCRREDRAARRCWFHLRREDFRKINDEEWAPRFRDDDWRAKQDRLLALRLAIEKFNAEENAGRELLYATPQQVAQRIKTELKAALELDLPKTDLKDLERENWEQQVIAQRFRDDFSMVAPERFGEDTRALAAQREEVAAKERELKQSMLQLAELQKEHERRKLEHVLLGADGESVDVERVLAFGGEHGRSVVIKGREGCGKSSLCAQLAREAEQRGLLVHVHLAECSHQSTKPVIVMRRIIENLAEQLGIQSLAVPNSLDKVSQALNLALWEANEKLKTRRAERRRAEEEEGEERKPGGGAAELAGCVIVFDGLDSFVTQDVETDFGLQAFSWMKRPMLSEINLVVAYTDPPSDLPTDAEHSFPRPRTADSHVASFLPKHFETLRLRALSVEGGVEIVKMLLHRKSKKLDDQQKDIIRKRMDTSDPPSPLTLSLLSEEIGMLPAFEKVLEDTKTLTDKTKSAVELCKALLTKRVTSASDDWARPDGFDPAAAAQSDARLAGTREKQERMEWLVRAVICLIVLARDGLELEELHRGVTVAQERSAHERLLPPYGRMELEFATAELAPFTRRIGSSPLRLGARNAVMLKAVEGTMMGAGDGMAMRELMLAALAEVFKTTPGKKVTARQAYELPATLQKQHRMYRELDEHARSMTKREELQRLVHRLDVFLELYKHEDRAELQCFLPDKESFMLGPDDDGKAVYQEALEVSLSLAATVEQAAEALQDFGKVAKFLQEIGHKDGVERVLLQGIKEGEDLLQTESDGKAQIAAVLVRLLLDLNTLYNRYQHEPSGVADDQPGKPPRLRRGLELLEQAEQLLEKMEEGEDKQLLTAQVWEGIGYIFVAAEKEGCAEAMGQQREQRAEDWFLLQLLHLDRILLSTAEPDAVGAKRTKEWRKHARKHALERIQHLEASKTKFTRGKRAPARIQALADCLNALGTALEQRLGEDTMSDTFYGDAHQTTMYSVSAAAYRGSAAMGELLNDYFVGRSLLSLAKLMERFNPGTDEALAMLNRSKQHYIIGLGRDHARLKHPYEALAAAYRARHDVDKAEENDAEVARLARLHSSLTRPISDGFQRGTMV